MATKYFKQPNQEDCLDAIGLTELTQDAAVASDPQFTLELVDVYKGEVNLTTQFGRAFVPDLSLHEVIPIPEEADWLACHDEGGETFKFFSHSRLNKKPTKDRHIIYLLPLVFFEDSVPANCIQGLEEFATYFFNLPVKVLDTLQLKGRVPSRINEYTKKPQVHGQKILDYMLNVIPKDAFCLAALTLCDLYPRDSWNFVFGLASPRARVGVYSLARYMPGFFSMSESTSLLEGEDIASVMKRACSLMCHEICHMFGMAHCIYYHCMMNGSNHQDESDRRPLNLCPVCLRKLHFACRFDVSNRYQNLYHFCQKKGMPKEAEWFQKKLIYMLKE